MEVWAGDLQILKEMAYQCATVRKIVSVNITLHLFVMAVIAYCDKNQISDKILQIFTYKDKNTTWF